MKLARIRPFVLAALLVVGNEGCASSPHPETTAKTLTVGQTESGKEIVLAVGDHLIVRLPSNHTTGYRWTLADASAASGILKSDGPAVYETNPNDATRVGAGGQETWSFTATHAGERELRLEYRRPWEHGASPVQVATFQIKVR